MSGCFSLQLRAANLISWPAPSIATHHPPPTSFKRNFLWGSHSLTQPLEINIKNNSVPAGTQHKLDTNLMFIVLISRLVVQIAIKC